MEVVMSLCPNRKGEKRTFLFCKVESSGNFQCEPYRVRGQSIMGQECCSPSRRWPQPQECVTNMPFCDSLWEINSRQPSEKYENWKYSDEKATGQSSLSSWTMESLPAKLRKFHGKPSLTLSLPPHLARRRGSGREHKIPLCEPVDDFQWRSDSVF